MSFGFSVGDFLTAGELIAQVISALREAGGSAYQYQRLKLELHSLKCSLEQVDRLEPAEGLEATVEAIKATALSCQLPLREFLESIRKYDRSLGVGESSGIMKDVLRKVKWVASKKLEAAMKLQAEVSAYLGSINLLLGLYQVYNKLPSIVKPLGHTETTSRKLKALAEQRARRRFESLTTTLANMQNQNGTLIENVAKVRDQVDESTRMVRKDIEESSKETSQALQRFQQSCGNTLSGFLATAGTQLAATLQTYARVSEMYNMLHSILCRLSGPDTRHTWLQEPIKFEDAYGRVWPMPVEFNYSMVEGALRGRFQQGRGSRLVRNNMWQLFDPNNPKIVFSAENWDPIPGMRITMAMILPQSDDKMVCPRLNCSSNLYTDALGGGKICLSGSLLLQSFTGLLADEEGDDESEVTVFGSAETPNPQYPEESRPGAESTIDEDDLRFIKHALLRRVLSKIRLTPNLWISQLHPAHPVNLIWKSISRTIRNLLQQELEHLNVRRAHLSFSIFLVGRKRAEPSATIIFCSENRELHRRAMSLVKRNVMSGAYPEFLLGHASSIPRLLGHEYPAP